MENERINVTYVTKIVINTTATVVYVVTTFGAGLVFRDIFFILAPQARCTNNIYLKNKIQFTLDIGTSVRSTRDHRN